MICADLERALGIGVSIVDLNDYGGSIRATSPKSPGEDAGSGALRQSDGPAAEKHALRARAARLIAFSR